MKKLCLFLATCAVTFMAQAQTVTFTFGSNNGNGESQAALDGLPAGSVTVNSLTLTAAANTGTFNSVASTGFGINATASGDATDQFDIGTGFADSMTFSFNKDVSFNTLALNSFVTGDAAYVTIGGTTTNITSNTFTFSGVNLAAGQQATFGATSGSFGLQNLTVTVVPEPSSVLTLISGFGILGLFRRRARSQR